MPRGTRETTRGPAASLSREATSGTTRTMTMTEAQRAELITRIEAADLESPEQVADMVLTAPDYESALAVLADCISADQQGETVEDTRGSTRK